MASLRDKKYKISICYVQISLNLNCPKGLLVFSGEVHRRKNSSCPCASVWVCS